MYLFTSYKETLANFNSISGTFTMAWIPRNTFNIISNALFQHPHHEGKRGPVIDYVLLSSFVFLMQ